MARAQGAVGIGPVKELSQLRSSLEKAIGHVKAGEICVVDVRVMPGYDAPVSGAGAASARR